MSNYSLFKISLNIIVMFKIFKYFTSFTSLLARHESPIRTSKDKKNFETLILFRSFINLENFLQEILDIQFEFLLVKIVFRKLFWHLFGYRYDKNFGIRFTNK